jgi:hypothetical protein
LVQFHKAENEEDIVSAFRGCDRDKTKMRAVIKANGIPGWKRP